MTEVLEQFQLSVGTLGEHWGAERFHDFLDCDGLTSELVFGRAVNRISVRDSDGYVCLLTRPDRKPPYQPVVSRCTWVHVNSYRIP